MNKDAVGAASDAGRANDAFRELGEAAQFYLDMLYACDPEMVDGIFHPRAQLCTPEDGSLVFRSVEVYKEVLRGRVSPKSKGAPREDQLITLDLATPTVGSIKVKMRINDLVFIDYLSMVKVDVGWRIVAKTYQRLLKE
jgi:Putative lumazine-binding